MLSFDVDGEFVWTAWNPATSTRLKTLTIGRYGPERGMMRILGLLDRHNVKATFFTVGKVAEQYPEPVREAARLGHEIAHHGYIHENFGILGMEEQRQIFLRASASLEKIAGYRPRGWRTPAGEMTADTLRLLEEQGFTWTSFMRGDDRPYFHVQDGRQSNIVEIPAHWELDDFPYFMYMDDPPFPAGQGRIASIESVFDIWSREFEGYYKLGLCFVIMFHPQTIGAPGRLILLDRLLGHMKKKGDVWFATGGEIAEYWRSYGRPNDVKQ
jgi:peptidoglycan/xylan/chitin deacetylase (PgdA/CDA1 family)